MLLGIVLHSALAYFPTYWAVTDSQADLAGAFDELVHFIHGFRMPLFFLLSGYFTAMLWRQRGVVGLITQRAIRVVVPLAVGIVTIVPLMDAAIDHVALPSSGKVSNEPVVDMGSAVATGDVSAIERLLAEGYDVNGRGDDGGTILHWAALVGDSDVVAALLRAGADPFAANNDGATPLFVAFAFANRDAADQLVAFGVPDERPSGQDWAEIEGWGFLAEEFDSVGASSDQPRTSWSSRWLPTFHHLWFLWFLVLFVAGFVVVITAAAAVKRCGPSMAGPPERTSSLILTVLIVASWWAQSLMGDGGAFRVFGPDTSTELIPQAHVLGYYALFFSFGAVLFGSSSRSGQERIDQLGRPWKWVLPVTVMVVFPLALGFTYGDEGAAPGPWGLATALQTLFTWGMILGLLGAFRVWFGPERRGVRFLSDSSYWLYLLHLPVVIFGQGVLRDGDQPALLKFAGLIAVITAGLLLSYQLLVRYTPIGWVLHGRRWRP